MKRIQIAVALIVMSGLVTMGTGQRAAAEDAKAAAPKLAGRWKLNRQLSDDPARKMTESMTQGEGPGGRGSGPRGRGGPGGQSGMDGGGRGGGGQGGMGGGERGGGGMGGPGMRSPFDGGASSDQEERPDPPRTRGGSENGGPPGGGGPRGPRFRMAASPEFSIDQDGDNLAFRSEHNLRLLHSDGRKRKKENELGKLEVEAKVVKGALVIETKSEGGARRKEIYAIDDEGRLRIEVETSAGRSTVKFNLVYDAANDAQF
jgi:hypothetical protein